MTVPFYVVLPDYSRSRIALVANGDGFVLPQFHREGGVRFNTVGTINSAVSSTWHIPVTVSRCLTPDEKDRSAIFAMHSHDDKWQLPPQVEWVDRARLPETRFNSPRQQQAVFDWLASETDATWSTVPWSSPDFFARACNWIRETVEAADGSVIGVPEQVRSWAISCILKVTTTLGVLYFKALPDYFGHEPVLSMYMQQYFPQFLVEIVAIEPQQHWMLAREFSGNSPQSIPEWRNVILALIEIQDHCSDNIDELLLFGCTDRRLPRLPELLMPVFEELKSLQMRELFGITEIEAQELARKLSLLPAMCDKLDACGIPETLIHGALWGPNIICEDKFSGKSPLIFDWSDASIAHPFFDIICAISSDEDPARKMEMQKAHIDAWSETYPREKVVAAFELAMQVAPFYYLLAYRHVTLNTPTEARWELLFLLKRFVRKILELR